MLPQKLQELRRQKGLTQKKLARLSGVSQSNISEIEVGKKYPKVPTLRKLAAALGVRVSDLIEESEDRAEARTG